MGLRLFAVACALFATFSVATLDCATAAPCARNSDCAVGYYCSATKGTCVRNCVDATRDCDTDQYCDVNGECAFFPDGAPLPDGSTADVVGNDVTAADVTTKDVSTDTTVTPDATTGSKIELDLCASDSECKSGLLCRALYNGGPTRCTPTCTQSSQCRAGARCLTIGTDTYCADEDVGRTCSTQTPGTCNYACVTPGYCTVQCTSGADCPNGYGCATVSNQKVCVRAEQYCGDNSTCTTLLCDNSIVASGCTLPCSSASDCPQRASILNKWTCSTNCLRPSDVLGPLGEGETASYACNTSNQIVNLCNDGQHIDFQNNTIPNPPSFSCPVSMSVDGTSGDQCEDSCRYSGGCAFGYECTGIGDISNTRIDLCTPSQGSGEVGAACNLHSDCAFGFCANNVCSRDCSADGICPTGSTCTGVGGMFPTVEGITFKRCQ